MKITKLKEIPKFKNEKAESEFWQSHDSAEYLDWNKAKWVDFRNIKQTKSNNPCKKSS